MGVESLMTSAHTDSRTIDLNADLGEGSPHEAGVMPYISSANIACGGHAGDRQTMRASLRLAASHGVAAGAHPGYPDREGFGRRDLDLAPAVLAASLREQIAALLAVAAEEGIPLAHVKPHGMLYNRAARDAAVARVIVQVVGESGIRRFYGLPKSELEREALALGLDFVPEGFADRGYGPDGHLWPRGQQGALRPHDEALAQGLSIARSGQVTAVTGETVAVPARTLCLHGDGAEAAELSRDLRAALDAAGVTVRPPA